MSKGKKAEPVKLTEHQARIIQKKLDETATLEREYMRAQQDLHTTLLLLNPDYGTKQDFDIKAMAFIDREKTDAKTA